MRYIALSALAAVALYGCAPVPTQQNVHYPPFPEAEYQTLPRIGDATVTGQVFLKTRGGDVKVGAGSEIQLFPVTSYSKVFYKAYQSKLPIDTPDPRVRQYTFRTQADATGSFDFKQVPAGQYYIGGLVTWEAPSKYGLASQGGYIAKEITVAPGSSQKVMLTEQ
ncbi:hypothetical protein [Pseudomonas phoenicis]|uniref:hypothetical protein n=1 Tax=unclassified Pseudomonas TaxID=196821 RepID=UPI0039A0915E